MSTFSLTINHWVAWTTKTNSLQEQVQDGANSEINSPPPDVSQVPPMLRRRLSSLGKMALSTAYAALGAHNKGIPSVFCSRHGDLQRTVNLLSDLADNNPLSPTQFSLSVHNAIAGVMSIARKDKSSITALSSMQQDIINVFLEAKGIMEEQHCHEVLCVIYDETVPLIYNQEDDNQSYSAAFLVTNDQSEISATHRSASLSFSIGHTHEGVDTNTEPQALQLLRFLLSPKDASLHLNGTRNSWTCSKLPKVTP